MITVRKKNAGFTLVELIIAIAILSILLTFVLITSSQMLTVTAKYQTRDKALSIAQARIEEMRSTLLIPEQEGPLEDPTWAGYFITVTSTRVINTSSTPTYVPFLRDVTVSVSTPVGVSSVVMRTYIQTYRPQVSFFLPVTNIAYIRDKPTVLEGFIRDDGYNITKVEVRTRTGISGTWSAWTSLTTLYADPGRQSAATLPLIMGQTYYFIYTVQGSTDGSILEIQIQATNTAGLTNQQPTAPYGQTSYVRLITDRTPPVALTTLVPTTSVTSGTQLRFTVMASDPIASGVSSGINNVYMLISKTPASGGVQFWHDIAGTTPYWSADVYYCTATASDPDYYYDWPITISPTNLAYDPGAVFTFKAFVLDNAIGKYYDYWNHIPTQGTVAGTEFVWPDVNANFLTTTPTSRTMFPLPTVSSNFANDIKPTSAKLRGTANPQGLSSQVGFVYGLTDPIDTIPVETQTRNDNHSFSYGAHIQNLQYGTTYHFRAVIQNDWGTFYGDDITFTTKAGNAPTIDVQSPNHDQSWNIGTPQQILWTSHGLLSSTHVKIEFSTDGGNLWNPIAGAESLADTGSYFWTVAGSASDIAQIRISAVESQGIWDPVYGLSDLFIIAP